MLTDSTHIFFSLSYNVFILTGYPTTFGVLSAGLRSSSKAFVDMLVDESIGQAAIYYQL